MVSHTVFVEAKVWVSLKSDLAGLEMGHRKVFQEDGMVENLDRGSRCDIWWDETHKAPKALLMAPAEEGPVSSSPSSQKEKESQRESRFHWYIFIQNFDFIKWCLNFSII